MSQASNAPSAVSGNSGLRNVPADIEDTASSVVLYGTDALPGMFGYTGASTSMIVPNTAYRMCHAQSPTETSASMRQAQSVSPVRLTIAQRKVQLAAQMASNAASDVSHVAASAHGT